MKPLARKTTMWDEVRRRLEETDARIASSFAPDQQLVDEVYRRRARRLADRRTDGGEADTLAVLVFGLGTEAYAFELSALAEVMPYAGGTVVPGSPPTLLGVINVRGEITPVVDLRRVLELPGEAPQGGYILMLRHSGRVIGCRVDTIDQVRQLDPAHLVSVEGAAAPIPCSRFVKALTADTVILIDASAVLSVLDPALT